MCSTLLRTSYYAETETDRARAASVNLRHRQRCQLLYIKILWETKWRKEEDCKTISYLRHILTKKEHWDRARALREGRMERRSCREKSGLFNCCRRQQLPPVPDWSHCWWLSQVNAWKHCNSKFRHMENYIPKRERKTMTFEEFILSESSCERRWFMRWNYSPIDNSSFFCRRSFQTVLKILAYFQIVRFN